MQSPHRPAQLAALLGLCAVFVPPVAVAAGIVPDGGTATTVTTGATGRPVVNIAPSTAGVSHNTYTSFDLHPAISTLTM
ncbi:hypothetical protein RPSD_50350 (plasmid) [Ralstonia solanacearum]|nr:hypothetical protein RPSD_50350 [Ralstonia solanacearum]